MTLALPVDYPAVSERNSRFSFEEETTDEACGARPAR